MLALVAWNNGIVHRVPGYPGSYVPVNLVAAAALVFGARALGYSWAELGLARAGVRSGLRWGGACALLVGCAYGLAVAVPGLRSALDSGGDDGAADLLVDVLVRIPLGTVLWEEIAFRGVLLAVLLRWLPLRVAVSASAVVFGLWHVRPALGGLPVDGVAGGGTGQGVAILVTVLSMTAAGVLLAWLRLRSGSVLAPALLHLATNALGALAAVAAHRLG